MPDMGGGYAANPQIAKSKANAERNRPIGEGEALYAPASAGPFRCGNCQHFDKGECDHPKVIAGPTKGKVETGGCCTYFRH